MRSLTLEPQTPQPPQYLRAPTRPLSSPKATAAPNPARGVWWSLSHGCAPGFSSTYGSPQLSSEALKNIRLALSLSRRGRQATAELALTLITHEDEATSPVTLFTGSWVAHLLGYSRKYRGAKLVEAFLGAAVRSYLTLYHFAPLSLRVRGPFFNFNFFWRVLNSPASQIFVHPITLGLVWDIRLPASVGSSFCEVREAMAEALDEFGRGGVPHLDDEILDYEARAMCGSLEARYRFS